MTQHSALMSTCLQFAAFVSRFDVAINSSLLFVLAIFTIACFKSRSKCDNDTCADQRWRAPFERELVYAVWIAVTIFVIRAPTWNRGEANLDESQWLAGAITLRDHFAFWGSVDGATSGPFIIHTLFLWNSLVGENSFEAAKLLTTILWIGISLVSYATLRQFSPSHVARVFVSPFVAWVALCRTTDYVGYNGEQLSILLLAWATFHLAYIAATARNEDFQAFWLGIVLGLLPYTKLQAFPIGMVIGLCGIAILRERRNVFILVVTLFALQVPIFAVLGLSNQLSDFWTSYVLQNLAYASRFSEMDYEKRFFFFLIAWWQIADGRAFLVACICLIVVKVAFHPKRWLATSRAFTVCTLTYLAMSAFVVAQPGTFFLHYYLLMFHPMLMATAAIVGGDWFNHSQKQSSISLQLAFFLLFVASFGPGIYFAHADTLRTRMQGPVAANRQISSAIASLSDQSTKLSIWGWMPRIYVETQLPQATVEACTFRQMVPGKYQEYFLRRYVQSLREQDDLIFIDVTGQGGSYMFRDPKFDHSNYPLLHEFVSENLEYLDTVEGIRIFRRRSARLR